MATSNVQLNDEQMEALKVLGLAPETMNGTPKPPVNGGTRREVGTGKPVDTEGMSDTEIALRAQIALLQAQAAGKSSGAQGQMTLHVSDKGALSVYGLGRFPVTLYAAQWERLMEKAGEIKAFIAKHERVAEVRISKGVQVSNKLLRK